MYREPGLSHKEFFARQFDGENCVVLDAGGRPNCAYVAVKGPRGVFAVVCLTRWDPNSHDNFAYKPMEETMGPCASQCPERILKLLSPVEDLYEHEGTRRTVQEWRDSCHAYHEKRKSAAAVKPGDRIRLANPMTFTDGVKRQEFTFVKRSTFRDDFGTLVKISNWKSRPFEKVR